MALACREGYQSAMSMEHPRGHSHTIPLNGILRLMERSFPIGTMMQSLNSPAIRPLRQYSIGAA